MLFRSCLSATLFFMFLGSMALFMRMGPYIPEKWYLVKAYGWYMLAYWILQALNIAAVSSLIMRRFRMIETGRKIKYLDPMRSADGTFSDEISRDDS